MQTYMHLPPLWEDSQTSRGIGLTGMKLISFAGQGSPPPHPCWITSCTSSSPSRKAALLRPQSPRLCAWAVLTFIRMHHPALACLNTSCIVVRRTSLNGGPRLPNNPTCSAGLVFVVVFAPPPLFMLPAHYWFWFFIYLKVPTENTFKPWKAASYKLSPALALKEQGSVQQSPSLPATFWDPVLNPSKADPTDTGGGYF